MAKDFSESGLEPSWTTPSLWKGSAQVPRCYESHPSLKLAGFEIWGGSCLYPSVKDADVYIGFDTGMHLTPKPYPWERDTKPRAVEVYFHIADGTAPKDPAQFKKMIVWTALQLQMGKKVHAGCIGGHGRTGLFLAALYTHMTGEKDSITHVRNTYCNKAVESATQVAFLNKHYGIKEVTGSKAAIVMRKPKSGWDDDGWESRPSSSKAYIPPPKLVPSLGKGVITPVGSLRNIWSAPK